MAKPGLNCQIAARVRQLRRARAIPLEALAARSGVSRSMISLVERGETSPTAVVLEKLATGLGVTLAGLFAFAPEDEPASPVMRRSEQAVWRDPASGYLRRSVSPSPRVTPMQIVEIEFPAGARVDYETGGLAQPAHHQVWVLEGAIEVTIGAEAHALARGDCLAFALDRPTTYRNPSRKPARYVVVIAAAGLFAG